MVTGSLSNLEIAERSSIGFFLFTPQGLNEMFLNETGFRVIAAVDVTEAVSATSKRWRDAREKHRSVILELEGETRFDQLQRFLDTVHTLASERRLSRHWRRRRRERKAGLPVISRVETMNRRLVRMCLLLLIARRRSESGGVLGWRLDPSNTAESAVLLDETSLGSIDIGSGSTITGHGRAPGKTTHKVNRSMRLACIAVLLVVAVVYEARNTWDIVQEIRGEAGQVTRPFGRAAGSARIGNVGSAAGKSGRSPAMSCSRYKGSRSPGPPRWSACSARPSRARRCK